VWVHFVLAHNFMSNPVTFSTNSDPFRGGSFTPAGSAGAVNGIIAGASTGGSLISSVTGGTPMLARNSRGTNITVPYARVVFHPPANTSLPPTGEAINNKSIDLASRMLKTQASSIMSETEMLYSGRMAFVLGRRGEAYTASVETAMGLDLLSVMGGQQIRGKQLALSSGSGGIATAQRLCSFEYLERYFSHVLFSRTIVVKDGSLQGIGTFGHGLKGARKDRLKKSSPADPAPPLDLAANTNPSAINAKEIIAGTSNINVDDASDANKAYTRVSVDTQGIDADSESPFLHGKSVKRQVHMGTAHKKTNLMVGDELAFKWLYNALLKKGILDWTPDGVVMSKLSEGDRLLDDELDSRDGMLFNVAVAGPAISSLWSQEAALEVMPLDRVFIVIVADRWKGDQEVALRNIDRKTYDELRASELKNGSKPPAKVDSEYTLTNFRVKRMTSAQMVAACMASDKGLSKLELKRGGDVADYIVGGWCIGSIIDSAASRAAPGDSSTLVGAMKRTRVNSAHNLVVKIEWWDSDKMCRSYGPRARRARYDGAKQRLPMSGKYPPTAAALLALIDGRRPFIADVDASLQPGLPTRS
jgi:hypothetical protein